MTKTEDELREWAADALAQIIRDSDPNTTWWDEDVVAALMRGYREGAKDAADSGNAHGVHCRATGDHGGDPDCDGCHAEALKDRILALEAKVALLAASEKKAHREAAEARVKALEEAVAAFQHDEDSWIQAYERLERLMDQARKGTILRAALQPSGVGWGPDNPPADFMRHAPQPAPATSERRNCIPGPQAEDRRPPPPESLVDALQDTVHVELPGARPAKSGKATAESGGVCRERVWDNGDMRDCALPVSPPSHVLCREHLIALYKMMKALLGERGGR